MNEEHIKTTEDLEKEIKKGEAKLKKEKENLKNIKSKCEKKIKDKELEIAGLAYDLNRLKNWKVLQ